MDEKVTGSKTVLLRRLEKHFPTKERLIARVTGASKREKMLAAAGVVGVSFGSWLPAVEASNRVVLRDRIDPPFDPADYPSPLSAHRRYVKGTSSDDLFRVTGVPAGVPIRVATMDQYDGVLWKLAAGANATVGSSGFFQRVGSEVNPGLGGVHTKIDVTINKWDEVWVQIGRAHV